MVLFGVAPGEGGAPCLLGRGEPVAGYAKGAGGGVGVGIVEGGGGDAGVLDEGGEGVDFVVWDV